MIRRLHVCAKHFSSIPVLAAGVLFLYLPAAAPAAPGELAAALAEAGDGSAAAREARRAQLRPAATDADRLLAGVTRLRQVPDDADAMQRLARLAASSTDASIRSQAAYAAGRAQLEAGRHARAFELLRMAYTDATDDDIFRRSGCTLSLLLSSGDLGDLEVPPGLRYQLDSSRRLWSRELRQACAIAAPGPSVVHTMLRLPARAVVALYRSQLAPAIGQRCSLHPSCSEYFLQASEAHGWLGIPMQGDRWVREPGHVQRRVAPMRQGDLEKYDDPVSDHDWWHRKP